MRTDAGSRLIRATPEALYRAYLDPAAVARWRPPAGMTAEVHQFEPHEGGAFRMAFLYSGDHSAPGKTSEHADVFHGRFVELVPNARIVERAEFESDDPAFAEAMTVTTTFTPAPGGTEVAVTIANVPDAIRPEDHAAGIASTLANLAAFVE